MLSRLFLLLVIGLWEIVEVFCSIPANAITPLTRAEIQYLSNLVQLIRKNNHKTVPAQKLDTLTPGDAVSTGRASLADLRFNDGSLARVGEQAVFKFLPQTRNFSLSNGTMLLLIPPGQGQTRIRTPNASAAIRGSALFVRYIKESDTTLIGALTDSGIEVFNREASQNHLLEAGQLMVVVKDKFQGLYDFDLHTFYETSQLVRGLNLTGKSAQVSPNPAIASVKAEIATALATKLRVTGLGVINNPSFSQNPNPNSRVNPPQQNILPRNPRIDFLKNNFPVNSLVETGQIIQHTQPTTRPITPQPTPITPQPTPSKTDDHNDPTPKPKPTPHI